VQWIASLINQPDYLGRVEQHANESGAIQPPSNQHLLLLSVLGMLEMARTKPSRLPSLFQVDQIPREAAYQGMKLLEIGDAENRFLRSLEKTEELLRRQGGIPNKVRSSLETNIMVVRTVAFCLCNHGSSDSVVSYWTINTAHLLRAVHQRVHT